MVWVFGIGEGVAAAVESMATVADHVKCQSGNEDIAREDRLIRIFGPDLCKKLRIYFDFFSRNLGNFFRYDIAGY